jgi:hypothetical protein
VRKVLQWLETFYTNYRVWTKGRPLDDKFNISVIPMSRSWAYLSFLKILFWKVYREDEKNLCAFWHRRHGEYYIGCVVNSAARRSL